MTPYQTADRHSASGHGDGYLQQMNPIWLKLVIALLKDPRSWEQVPGNKAWLAFSVKTFDVGKINVMLGQKSNLPASTSVQWKVCLHKSTRFLKTFPLAVFIICLIFLRICLHCWVYTILQCCKRHIFELPSKWVPVLNLYCIYATQPATHP